MAVSDLSTDFVGGRGRLFWMSLGMGLLTVLTLGVYRFWMKTRLRRYYWSSIRPGGHPLEYVGDPLEKLLGFFIAVVILAFYIGVVNLILMFVSFSLFDGNAPAYVVSFLGVIPLWFYARYRARRYVLARTRWRGIRFGVDPAAWGYAWRAMLYWALTLVSGTLLWPLMTHRLEKFRIDRTWYGDRRLHQGGTAKSLAKGLIPFWIGLGLLGVMLYGTVLDDDYDATVGLIVLAAPLLGLLFAYYSVRSFRILTAAKSAGSIGFASKARTTRVIGIYVLGYGLAATLTLILTLATAIGIFALMFVADGAEFSFDDIDNLAGPGPVIQVLGLVAYFMIFLAWSTFRHVFVTLPLWRHYAETLTITHAEGLHEIRQRARDEHREAEGFAEALDLGAAI